MRRLLTILLAMLCILAISCDGHTPGADNDGPASDLLLSASNLAGGYDIDTGNAHTVKLTGLDADRVYCISTTQDGSRSVAASGSNLVAKDGSSWFIIPDEDGTASIGITGSPVCIYEVPEEPFNSPADLHFEPGEDNIVYYDDQGRPVHEAYFRIDLTKAKDYGIDDPSSHVMDILRLGNGGGYSTTCIMDNHANYIGGGLDAYEDLDSVRIFFSLHKFTSSAKGYDDNLRYEVMMGTPKTLEEGQPQTLQTPSYYIVPKSDEAQILEIKTKPEANGEYRLHNMDGTTCDDGSIDAVQRFIPLWQDESTILAYIAPDSPEFHFPFFLEDDGKLSRLDDVGTITLRTATDDDISRLNEDVFTIFDADGLVKGEKKTIEISLPAGGENFFPVILFEGSADSRRSLRLEVDETIFDVVNGITVQAFGDRSSSSMGLHPEDVDWDEYEKDPSLELSYAYAIPRQFVDTADKTITITVSRP